MDLRIANKGGLIVELPDEFFDKVLSKEDFVTILSETLVNSEGNLIDFLKLLNDRQIEFSEELKKIFNYFEIQTNGINLRLIDIENKQQNSDIQITNINKSVSNFNQKLDSIMEGNRNNTLIVAFVIITFFIALVALIGVIISNY